MNDLNDAVRRKFGHLRRPEDLTRRDDFKGYRRRINLRVRQDLAEDLDVIKLASGVPKNEFCERILEEAIAQKIAELERQHDQGAWQTLRACAARRTR